MYGHSEGIILAIISKNYYAYTNEVAVIRLPHHCHPPTGLEMVSERRLACVGRTWTTRYHGIRFYPYTSHMAVYTFNTYVLVNRRVKLCLGYSTHPMKINSQGRKHLFIENLRKDLG